MKTLYVLPIAFLLFACAQNKTAMTEGDMDAGAWSCGMVAGLIYDIPTCQELIDRIMNEANGIITERLARFHQG